MSTNPRSTSVQSVERALKLVRLLASSGQVRLSEASRAIGVPASTAHRLLAALQNEDFATHVPPSRYYLAGPALHAVMAAVDKA